MNIGALLEEKLRNLPGRPMTVDEGYRLNRAIPELAVPAVTELLRTYPIIGSEMSLPEELDGSGLGVELLWLSGDQIIGEATEAQPGVAAARHGFLPIGACLLGSGDRTSSILANQTIHRWSESATTPPSLTATSIRQGSRSCPRA